MKRSVSFLRTLYAHRRQRPVLPRFLTYLVTFACNARCIMCDSWQKPATSDLTLAEIETIFSQLPKMDGVRLSGGEPFLRRDLLDITHLAQETLKPLFLHITTNGFLSDRIIEFCEQRRKNVPLYVLISIDGMEDKHNAVRGKDFAWENAVRTIQALAPRQKELRINILVNQTIVDAEGIEHYAALRDFLKPWGIQNNLVMAYDVSATYSREQEVNAAPGEIGEFCTYGQFDRLQLEALIAEVEQDMKAYPFLTRLAKQYYLSGIHHRLLKQEGYPNPKCVALSSHLRLFPDGSVPTCQFNTRSVGNLREQSFKEIWNNPIIQKQREWVNRCPGCWAECEVLPNAIYSGDLFKKSLKLQRRTRVFQG